MILDSLYLSRIKTLDCLEKCLSESLDFVMYSFVYGSTSKFSIKDSSDIDLLLIGSQEKTLDLLISIDECLEKYCGTFPEIDFKYYQISTFMKLRTENEFLKSIEKDCKRIGDLKNELLRFC